MARTKTRQRKWDIKQTEYTHTRTRSMIWQCNQGDHRTSPCELDSHCHRIRYNSIPRTQKIRTEKCKNPPCECRSPWWIHRWKKYWLHNLYSPAWKLREELHPRNTPKDIIRPQRRWQVYTVPILDGKPKWCEEAIFYRKNCTGTKEFYSSIYLYIRK